MTPNPEPEQPTPACFSCGDDLADGDSTPFRGAPGYSSTYDETGELELRVCDPCLTRHQHRVTRITTTHVTSTRREPWQP
ncbi:hypothetical protein [Actinomadura litoris]|uniref:Uncharacterized protein n=1 Tax=Actinomadura litoris TaxID=2678616 RepID=A0A7K1LB14_9ACTN|nr:hypothetical protein [Actinomadura litoris]MUN41436.1 hypothetical protein [Actinomadura litoris]